MIKLVKNERAVCDHEQKENKEDLEKKIQLITLKKRGNNSLIQKLILDR